MVIAASSLPPATANATTPQEWRSTGIRTGNPFPIIHISDLPTTVSRKYTYTDDLAIMHADGDWQAVVMLQSKDMATVSEYRQTWKLKLSTTKSVLVVFHLNNKEARRELKVNHNNETLPFWSEPIYLARMFERTLTYRRHLESFRKKLASCVALLRQLDGPGWVLEQQRCKQPT